MQVYVLVEGQTEEAFIKNCLGPFLSKFNIYITPVVVQTKTILSGAKVKGGLNAGNLDKFFRDIRKLLHSVPSGGLVTTLIDFYAIPHGFPGFESMDQTLSSHQKVAILELALHDYFGMHIDFLPYIQLHELEALMFSDPIGFESYFDPAHVNVQALVSVIASYNNPELINSKKETSPSHRILRYNPTYIKPLIGNMMLLEIGIEKILVKCPRFNYWVQSILARKQQ